MTDDLTDQIRQELERLNPVVSELLSLNSQWDGTVELVDPDPLYPYWGKKLYRGSIEIDRAVAQTDVRWRTLIHELIHAHSVGLTPDSLKRFRGWEEGTVENLQRLLRRRVLEQIGIQADYAAFLAAEANFEFQVYVEAVEDMRRELAYEQIIDRDAISFFKELLRTPLAQRPAYVLSLALNGSAKQKSAFIRRYSAINSRLRHTA